MIVRIVKLTFKDQHVSDFHSFFEEIKHLVNGFSGCKGMQLLTDKNNVSTFFTYSWWESENDLNAYRDSPTFGTVWPKIKPWFANKPEAWTTEVHFNGFEQ